jgi:hypothetical protein
MAARPNLKDEDRKRPYKPRGPYKNRGVKRGTNPNSWIVGPDTRRHDQYSAWLKHKAQAAFRREPHELSFEQWETLWNEDWAWENRGRASNCVNLTRVDKEKGWTLDNVVMIERISYLQEAAKELQNQRHNRGK